MNKEKSVYQSDTLMKDFWRKTDNFEDVCNGLLFHGHTLISDAVELDSEHGATEGGSIQRRRDLIKMASINGKNIIIGIENQQYKDKTMPFRDMEYTNLKYGIRLKDKRNKVCPIITIVIYYGCTKWSYKTELQNMMEIPEEVEEYFNNWKTIVIDAKEVDYQVFQTKEVKDFFEGLQNLYSWDGDIENLKGLDLTYDTAMALGIVTGTSALIKKAKEEREGVINMCQAVDEALQAREAYGRNIGLQEGRTIGLQEGKMQGKRMMIKQQLIKRLGSLSQTVIDMIEKATAESIDLLSVAIFEIENEEDILRLIN